MPFEIQCPHCGRDFSLGDELRGKKLRCAGCRELFVAGAPASGAATGPAKAAGTKPPALPTPGAGMSSGSFRPIRLEPETAKPARAATGTAPRATPVATSGAGTKAPLAMPIQPHGLDEELGDSDPLTRPRKLKVGISIPPKLIKGVALAAGLIVVAMLLRSFWPEVQQAIQSTTTALGTTESSAPSTAGGDQAIPATPASDADPTDDATSGGAADTAGVPRWKDGKGARPGADLETALGTWQKSAESFLTALGNPAEAADWDTDKLEQLASLAAALARDARTAVALVPADAREATVGRVSVPLQNSVTAMNRTLREQQENLKKIDSVELNCSDLAATLQEGLLPVWFGDQGLAATNTSATGTSAGQTPTVGGAASSGQPFGGGRNFRAEARAAMAQNRTRDAERFLCAALLTGDDETVLDQVKWCPGLERYAAFVHVGIGAQLKDVPQTGPSNLRPTEVAVRLRRSPRMEAELNAQLVNVTGPMGAWLAEGLIHRVTTGVFGDWGSDQIGHGEHRGSSLMDFASLDKMLAASKTQNVDILLVFSLDWRGMASNSNVPNFARTVQLYNVATGKKLIESDELLDTKTRAAYRNGKKPDVAQVERILKYIDTKLSLSDSEPTANQFKARLAKIEQEDASAPIEGLVELRYLQLKKAITDDVAQERMAALVGEEAGKALASGDAAARYQAVDKLVPALKPGE